MTFAEREPHRYFPRVVGHLQQGPDSQLDLRMGGIPVGIIWTPIALHRNDRAIKQLRQLAGR
jgi:hypothetical protein